MVGIFRPFVRNGLKMTGDWRYAIIICACVWFGDTARILVVVPTPSFSHQVVFRPVVQKLARRGHEVVILTTDPAFPAGQAPPNLTEIDLHDISYPVWIDRFMKTASGKQNDLYTQIYTAFDLMLEIFPKQMKAEAVKKMIADEKFDLVISEAWMRPPRALSYVFNTPLILIGSGGALDNDFELMGAPVHPLLYPNIFRTRVYNLTLWEKVKELYNWYQMCSMISSFEAKEDAMLREVFGADVPSLEFLNKKVELLMSNIDPVFEGDRPVPPNMIYLGSLNETPVKKLPQDLQSWMDSSKHGVIYMSFGTNTDPSLLPADRMAIFSRVFSKLPYDVLWKWKDPPATLPANVRTSSWFPQPDVLRHKKIVLFITQAGLQSTDEALQAGVPLLAFPMLGDQWYNAEQYVRLGVGRKLDLVSFTEDQLRENIEELIKDQGYRTRSKLIGEEMRDRPQTSLQRAVWWIERTLRQRNHRRAPAMRTSWLMFIDGDLLMAGLAFMCSVALVLFGLYKILTKRDLKVKSN